MGMTDAAYTPLITWRGNNPRSLRKFDWDTMFNGETHRLTGAQLAPMEPLEFGRHARKVAARRGVRVSVRTTSTGGGVAEVKCLGPRPAAVTK